MKLFLKPVKNFSSLIWSGNSILLFAQTVTQAEPRLLGEQEDDDGDRRLRRDEKSNQIPESFRPNDTEMTSGAGFCA